MKIKFTIFSLAILFVWLSACSNNNEPEVDILDISGITNTNTAGDKIGPNVDDGDWLLNYQFTDREKELFDTLNFNETAEVEPEESTGSIVRVPNICFGSNPCDVEGLFYIYKNFHVINLVLVNNKYEKLIIKRIFDANVQLLDFSDLNTGIYRLYYVIQDNNYKIVYTGYGDIEKQ